MHPVYDARECIERSIPISVMHLHGSMLPLKRDTYMDQMEAYQYILYKMHESVSRGVSP